MLDMIIRELEQWLSKRCMWLQDAANRLNTNSVLSKSDLDELLLLCKNEAGVSDCNTEAVTPKRIPVGSFKDSNSSSNLRLCSISNISGIGALAPQKPLVFGDKPLTVVYGRNGSGKSSYVRALKHACGARSPGKLLGNIFNKQNATQGCTFKIKYGDTEKEIPWTSEDGVIDEFKSVDIYDTDCGYIYLNTENEITYEPWALSLLTKLSDCCIEINQRLQKEIDQTVSKKPVLPEEYKDTLAGIWYTKLTYNTTNKEVDSRCLWNEALENELNSYKQRLAESDPSEKAKQLRKMNASIETLLKKANVLETGLSEEKCKEYLSYKYDAALKRKTADIEAKKVFENAPLDGVGSDSWKLLWEQARAYSEKVAYPSVAFPNTTDGAKCVLCHQPLSPEAKGRLISFEEFVKGKLEKIARDAENLLKRAEDEICQVPQEENIDLMLVSAGITDDEELSKIKMVFECFRKRRDTLLNATKYEEVVEAPDVSFLQYLSKHMEEIEMQARAYEDDAINDNRDIIKAKIKELEAQKWIFQQKKSIEDEIVRLKRIEQLEKAKKLTSTNAISIKSSEMSNKFVTEAYIKRFQDELKNLGASHIKVELKKTRIAKGRILHQVKLVGCTDMKCTEILSEGELRIISLAAFLADVGVCTNNTPIIFDDPISSLDQDYEEATVKRLVDLCAGRQVIVFTHRLSLLSLLQDEATRRGIGISVLSIRNEDWGAGEPNDISICESKPDTALNKLLYDRLSNAKKILEDYGRAEYDLLAKGICVDFRIIIERFIERFLLNGIVVRFRKDVQTKNKLHKLTMITKDDCDLFDYLMTKYSKFVHSQSDETPVEIAHPDTLKTDMGKLKMWYEQFNKRSC